MLCFSSSRKSVFFELFHFPTSTGPKAASIAFFPTVFFIESSFYKPSSHLASRHSPLSTLCPPTWPWARKSIKLLITGGWLQLPQGQGRAPSSAGQCAEPGRSGCAARPGVGLVPPHTERLWFASSASQDAVLSSGAYSNVSPSSTAASSHNTEFFPSFLPPMSFPREGWGLLIRLT